MHTVEEYGVLGRIQNPTLVMLTTIPFSNYLMTWLGFLERICILGWAMGPTILNQFWTLWAYWSNGPHNIYISKSLSVVFIVTMFLLSHIIRLIPPIFFLFLTLILLINFVPYYYTSSNLLHSLLPFHLSTTLNLNVTLPLFIHLNVLELGERV